MGNKDKKKIIKVKTSHILMYREVLFMKDTIKVISVIMGTIIGAGFASGKEIYIFFVKYGKYGILGIIISSTIIGLIIYKVLQISKKEKVENYEKLLKKINNNEKINEIIKNIINIFLLISFYIMIAGFSAYFSQELKIPNIIGTILICIICYITFKGNIESLIKVNTILIPILLIFIIILAAKNITAIENINKIYEGKTLLKSIFGAILYSSYNSITLIPIIISLKKHITNKKQIKIVAIITTILLIILAMSIYIITLKIDININQIELPTIYVAGMIGKIYKYIYGIIILIAIYTSAISAGYGILENYIKNPKKYKKISKIMCISGIIVSNIGFGNLVNSLYPVFGILGITQIILISKKK